MKKILNWLQFNEGHKEDYRDEYCDGCGCLRDKCECEVKDEDDDDDDMKESYADLIDEIEELESLEEKKKMNKGFAAYLAKMKANKKEDKGDKKVAAKKGAKPDFLDLDKDGDKKEPMKKASEDAKKKKGDK